MADYARVAWNGENPFENVRERERELVEVVAVVQVLQFVACSLSFRQFSGVRRTEQQKSNRSGKPWCTSWLWQTVSPVNPANVLNGLRAQIPKRYRLQAKPMVFCLPHC